MQRQTLQRLFAIGMLSLTLCVTASVEGGTAPTGTYHEAIVQVVLKGETVSEHFPTSTLNATIPELHKFFSDLSYGKLNFQAQYVQVTLSHDWAFYGICGTCSALPLLKAAVAAALADNPTFFNGVQGVSVLALDKGTYLGSVGWTEGCGLCSFTGVSQKMAASFLTEDPTLPASTIWSNWSHEFGHQFQAHSGSTTHPGWVGHPSGYSSGYDLMDSCYPCDESAFGKLGAPHVTDTRMVFPGWLDSSHVATVPIPTSGTVTKTFVLPPISEDNTTGAIQAVQIPIDANRSYWVNSRKIVAADTYQNGGVGIASQGVQIQYADADAPYAITVCRPFETPTCTSDNSTTIADWPYRMWPVGNTYTDSNNNVTISVVSAAADGYKVTITRGVAPTKHPDLYITPWLTPPMDTYETKDIWVDSSCNGYGVLRYGKRADGTVIGSGDDPCVNHENRVYVTIHNIGDADSPPTVASFQVTSPLGVGVSGSWTSLGGVAVPVIAAGSSATVFVTWTPTPTLTGAEIDAIHFAFHSCIQVTVAPVPGELVDTNNSAQENIQDFEAVATGPAVAGKYPLPIINKSFILTNSIPGNLQEFTLRAISKLPAGWTFSINEGAELVRLASGATDNIPVTITPAPSAVGRIYHLHADAVTLSYLQNHGHSHASLFIEGGLDIGAHAVLPSQITVSATETGPNNPPLRIQVQGTLAPINNDTVGSIVTVDVYDAANDQFSTQATVQADGSFSATMMPPFVPSSVRAIWQGTVMYSSAVAVATIHVQ